MEAEHSIELLVLDVAFHGHPIRDIDVFEEDKLCDSLQHVSGVKRSAGEGQTAAQIMCEESS
jgi:hypothetical protein